MPAQTTSPEVVFYVEGDTGPSLRARIIDANGDPISLASAASATIRIAPQRWSYYYSPVLPIVDDAACVIDPDQVTNTGYLDWFPDPGDLSPAGQYQYTFRITWGDGTVQTFPQDVTLPLVIRARVGGNT